ncbi:hypothetical protein ACFV23_30390 [Streptomyces sp. NPDC059627]
MTNPSSATPHEAGSGRDAVNCPLDEGPLLPSWRAAADARLLLPVGPGSALLKVLAALVFGVYLLVRSIVVSQVGWILPPGVTTLVAVFAIGFSWMPPAVIPWKELGLGGVVGDRFAHIVP